MTDFEINMKSSADLGNSTTKIIVRDGVGLKARKQQTVYTHLPSIPRFEDEDVHTLVSNLHKNMVVHITSPSIARNGLYAVGELAKSKDGTELDISHDKKADHDITIIQPLVMTAVTAIQNTFEQTNELPKALTINVEYATAIPVVDHSKAIEKQLEARLKGTHLVVVYVGEGLQTQVTVNITAAKVVQEGIPALYALVEADESMFLEYNKRYGVNFTGRDFTNRKILFVDIGDGTTELINVVDGRPIFTKSNGIRAGVGHVSEKAMQSFIDKYRFNSELKRAMFMDKVLNKRDKWHNEANKELELMMIEQENKLFNTILSTVEKTLLNDVDDIVCFGGGTNVFTSLEQRLIDYAERYKIRVLWIKGKQSALLNAIGLDELNTKVFFKKG